MTETETKRNHECSYNKYYNMPSREELHMKCSPYLTESDFLISKGKNQKRSRIADKIASEWVFDEKCRRNIEAKERKIEVME